MNKVICAKKYLIVNYSLKETLPRVLESRMKFIQSDGCTDGEKSWMHPWAFRIDLYYPAARVVWIRRFKLNVADCYCDEFALYSTENDIPVEWTCICKS